MSLFDNTRIIVVGGAGFVGSNLVKMLLDTSSPSNIIVIDNLLSAEKDNIPDDSRITFLENSITEDAILNRIDDSFDFIFHLATYHGNQSSIHDPIADHDNNTLTTLKLFNHIKDFNNIKKVVYSGAGCAVAAKDVEKDVRATSEDAPISLNMDSPYSISKITGIYIC